MRTLFIDYALTAVMLFAFLTNCGYKERGHANTPPENPGSQVKTGPDTLAHPGNIDRDTIHLHH